MEIVLSGDVITALEAKEYGCRTQPLLDKSLEIAPKIAEKSLPVLIMAKEAVNRSFELSLEEGMKNERRLFQSTFFFNRQKRRNASFF